jgi:hypothetical protein
MSNNSPRLVFSYSGIKQFEQCPRQYHEVRILKRFKSEGSEATDYGTAVHTSMENYLMHGTPLPPEHSRFQKAADGVKATAGTLICEQKMGMREDFTPCDFFAKDVWFRGVPDVLLLQGARAGVADWKTGKSSRYADFDQMELMSAMVLVHYPEVQEVRTALLFLVANDALRRKYTRPELPEILSKWTGRANNIVKALENNVWNPRKNNLCRFCPVSKEACEFKE